MGSQSKHCNGMVDISDKAVTKRRALATATITFEKKAFGLFLKQGSPKGDVLETAKIAGIMAAKQTPSVLPLCHPLVLDKVKVTFEIQKSKRALTAAVEVISTGKTGVEMEALTAAAVVCLTVYDMMKWAGQGMTISKVQLIHKSGGKSGTYERS